MIEIEYHWLGLALLAVLVFGEPFGRPQAVGFGIIWVALALYSVDTFRTRPR